MTGSVDASAIPNAVGVWIYAYDNSILSSVFAAVGTFKASYLSLGITDFAAVAIDASYNVLGVKIVRSQTVPGALNGGNPGLPA